MVAVPSRAHRAGGGTAILTALIIGSANTLADDQARARELFTPDLLIACNHAGIHHPGDVDHWVTMHPDLFPLWLRERRQRRYTQPHFFWHARHRVVPDGINSQPIESWGGSSGLLCVAVAFELGVTHAVLAGIPLQKNACHFDDPRPWTEAKQYQWAWERRKDRLLGRVKSMSGWTRDLLGEPEGDWLADTNRPAARAS